MGVVWNKPREVNSSQGKSMVISASFPKTELAVQQLWNLWRAHKTAIKADGFSLGKWQNNWQISYWHKINSNSLQLVRNADGTEAASYVIDFKSKYRKWRKSFDEMPAVVPKPVETKQTYNVNAHDDDGDDDYVDIDDLDDDLDIDPDDLDL